MPKVRVQSSYSTLEFSADGSLNIHQRQQARAKTLVIFVHGLNGSAYGTWGDFPRLIFEDSTHDVDVAIYRYLSGLKRLTRLKTAGPLAIEERLADEFRDCGYSNIVIVAHSMGGLIAGGAIRRYFERDARNQTRTTFSLMLMASPRAGSRFGLPLVLLSSEGNYLRMHNGHLRATEQYFCNRTIRDVRLGAQSYQILVPTYTVSASRDIFVDDFSSSFNVPSEQQRHLEGTHTSIVKPANTDSESYQWVAHMLNECCDRGPAVRTARQQSSSQQDLIVSFQYHPAEQRWRDAFDEAVALLASQEECRLVDASYFPSEPAELAVRVLRSGDIQSEAMRAELVEDDRLQQERAVLHLAISPYDESGQDRSDDIYGLIGEGPRSSMRWVSATKSYGDLRDRLLYWFGKVLTARPQPVDALSRTTVALREAEDSGPRLTGG